MNSKISLVGRLMRNALIDMRFGPPLAATYLRNRKQSNSDYRELATLFDGRVSNSDVLVDVGCGAGRVINQWLRMGITSPIHGLEVDERLASLTRRRLRRRRNVIITTGDAIANLPADGSVFFLFNPFDESTTRRFAVAIGELADSARRDVRVIYLNCKHIAAFGGDDRFDVDIIEPGPDASPTAQRHAHITVHPDHRHASPSPLSARDSPPAQTECALR